MSTQVVPFSPAAGLLEWVEDTEPLGKYLLGEDRVSGAHRRYARPGDYSFLDCYQAVDKGQHDGRPRQGFEKVLSSSTASQSIVLIFVCNVLLLELRRGARCNLTSRLICA